MEERKLTKADIDKVRHIEGFPIGKDEDIIALSRPPYYTACPNPFIEDFIRENGTPYDEATDNYHREPFAADVSEGKNDPIYNAHSYHTKVPYKAIMRYILHYTKPGDIVFDGFCGTGMTGVAAQMCGCPDNETKYKIEQEMKGEDIHWGMRKAVLNDLSPAATFIAYNYTTPLKNISIVQNIRELLDTCEKECSWMYKTRHVDGTGKTIVALDGTPVLGKINYVVWSDVFVCPSCSAEIVYWEQTVENDERSTKKEFICPKCRSILKKSNCQRAQKTYYDAKVEKTVAVAKQVPTLISYTVAGKKYEKKPDDYDYQVIESCEKIDIDSWFPCDYVPDGDNSSQAKKSHGFDYVHQYYYRRSLLAFAKLWEKAEATQYSNSIRFLLTSVIVKTGSKFHNIGIKNGKINLAGQMPNVLFVPSAVAERNIFDLIRGKLKDMEAVFLRKCDNCDIITCGDASNTGIPSMSIDYIFVDPPFGGNINYSELNYFWEAWLRIKTNNKQEAIINRSQNKSLYEYQTLMDSAFAEFYRVLKPNHWITIEFHNSQNAVWNAINEGLLMAGFVIADVRVLDKRQGTFKQMTTSAAVKQDLVISAYKPKESFVREFQKNAGDPEMVWEFVRQHLRNVPVVADGNHDGKLDIIAERQDYLLFDRMVAWHIMNGIPVPMDAHTFYDGLRQRFLQRDGMFFLPDQVNEYDDKRAHMELDTAQLSFIVTDEKNAIQWLNYILAQGPMTYQEIQPLYMQELHQSRQEKMPELLDMLKENFVQDEKGAWYVPDLTNAADLAKVRRKALLKEFWDSCATGKGKLKVFRMEAIRAGFDECWKTRDFKTIVAVGERLPEAVLQEDPALLMYYDNACSRV